MSLDDKLIAYDNSPAFKKKVAEARKAAHKSGKAFGHTGSGGVARDIEYAKREVEAILSELEAVVDARFPGMKNPLFNSIPSPILMQDGRYQFSITFCQATVRRDSLYEEKYEDGVDLIALYSHGSSPSKDFVAGVWIPSVKSKYGVDARHLYIPKGYFKSPDDFLRQKVDELNRRLSQKNISIILDTKYYPKENDNE